MYMLPVVDSSIIDGSSDEHPLVLEGVEKAAFEQLLRVLYPPWLVVLATFDRGG